MSQPPLHDYLGIAPVGIVGRNSVDFLRHVFERLGAGEPVVTLRSAHDEERLEAARPRDVEEPAGTTGWVEGVRYEPRVSEDIAQILFTSGTEGASKGILLSHRALTNTTDRLVSVMRLGEQVREYVGIPVHFSFGFGRCRSVLHSGGALYLPPDGFNPVEIVELLRSGRINAVSAVPTLWRLVLGRPDLFDGVRDRVRWIEIGSQFMSGAEKLRLRTLFPEAVIVQHYGLTEASRTTFLEIHDAPEDRLDSVGRARDGLELGLDDRSCIRIRGPHLASAVLREGRVHPLVDEDGWFTTSDEGHFVDDYLYFDGRADDVINFGGVKLSPDWLERRIEARLPTQGAVGVARVPDELRGDGVLVAVLSSAAVESADVRAAAAGALSEAGVSASGGVHLLEVDSLPVTQTGKLQRKELRALFDRTSESRPTERPAYDPPRDDVERFLAREFERIFAIPDAGLADSILQHGADSLRAVELVAAVDAELGVELPLASLVEAPTLVGIADAVRWRLAGHEPTSRDYVVPLATRPAEEREKIFVVGGSYGNVLHLHDLALGLVDAFDVFGIQYRGLLKDDRPRETLPDTAADFVGEVVQVQPSGPYRLAGYSGGGLIAMEMARQLLERGEEVRTLMMVDTRLPARPPYQQPFSMLERQRIRLIESRRAGKGPVDLVTRAARKALGLVLPSLRRPTREEDLRTAELSPTKRRSEMIHLAYRRAVDRYEIPHLRIRLDYFRPRDEAVYALSSGSIDFVDSEAHRVDGEANGWTAYFDGVVVRSTPGGHYTMAHAPHARELAVAMLEALG